MRLDHEREKTVTPGQSMEAVVESLDNELMPCPKGPNAVL